MEKDVLGLFWSIWIQFPTSILDKRPCKEKNAANLMMQQQSECTKTRSNFIRNFKERKVDGGIAQEEMNAEMNEIFLSWKKINY